MQARASGPDSEGPAPREPGRARAAAALGALRPAPASVPHDVDAALCSSPRVVNLAATRLDSSSEGER